ncbi:MAG TPA: DUF4130 domain-containing protein [Thermoplasmata archaeon]
MLVLFKPSPQSILKAYMAGRIHKSKPVELSEGSRYYFDETVEADALDYDSLYSQYKESFGGLDFLEDEALWEVVEDEIFWASRFDSPDRFQLIFTVLLQIERTGTKAYLAQQSSEAREMKDRVRRVTGEFRRSKKFLAFEKDERNKVVVGKGSFEHRIVDLVLRHFAKRYPGYSVVILDDKHAHICYKEEILIDSRKRFPESPSRKDASRYWMLLTDLKHLEEMKDPDYNGSPHPRNYWKWISEGVLTYGTVPSVTLDSFGG